MNRCERCGKQADELFAVCCGAPSCDCGRSEERICDPCWQAAKEQGEVTDGDTHGATAIKFEFNSPVGPRVLYPESIAADEIEASLPSERWSVDWSSAVKTSLRDVQADEAIWSAPLVYNNVSQYLAKIGRKGGAAGRGSAKARTSEQARAAAQARWSK